MAFLFALLFVLFCLPILPVSAFLLGEFNLFSIKVISDKEELISSILLFCPICFIIIVPNLLHYIYWKVDF